MNRWEYGIVERMLLFWLRIVGCVAITALFIIVCTFIVQWGR